MASPLRKNHPFIDGNKRAAFIAMMLFLELNGLRVVADQAEAAAVMLAVAAGEIAAAETRDLAADAGATAPA